MALNYLRERARKLFRRSLSKRKEAKTCLQCDKLQQKLEALTSELNTIMANLQQLVRNNEAITMAKDHLECTLRLQIVANENFVDEHTRILGQLKTGILNQQQVIEEYERQIATRDPLPASWSLGTQSGASAFVQNTQCVRLQSVKMSPTRNTTQADAICYHFGASAFKVYQPVEEEPYSPEDLEVAAILTGAPNAGEYVRQARQLQQYYQFS